jgi:hypothetical protein
MCTEVEVRKDGNVTLCETIGQLAAALNVTAESLIAHRVLLSTECCLCAVDIEKFGARKATYAEGWTGVEYIIDVQSQKGGDHG